MKTIRPQQEHEIGTKEQFNPCKVVITGAGDVGSVWFELRMDMPGMAMQAASQLEKGQSPGVFNGSIRPTGQGEWHASIGYENRQGKDSTSFTTSVGP